MKIIRSPNLFETICRRDSFCYTSKTDAADPEPSFAGKKESESSILSSILPDKLSGSICTAVLFVLGWKLLSNKR
ncbi:unnamed protein product [Danaus chrysippus]|uniref:(African queen) hypothetical protein n=1 Tax=Danaus chrysippus TaxID=151541 RepID=A0A8J2QRP4_9NEOP|nr:unnamed protein product [Danaus chrysippus]